MNDAGEPPDVDYHVETLRDGLRRAMLTDRAVHVLVSWAANVSRLAMSVPPLGDDAASAPEPQVDHLVRVHDFVHGLLRIADESSYVDQTAAQEAALRALEVDDPDGVLGVVWGARAALAMNGRDCAVCGYWEPGEPTDDLGDVCPHCGGNSRWLVQIARSELKRANPRTVVPLRDLDDGIGTAIRALVPDADPASTIVLSTYTGTAFQPDVPFGEQSVREQREYLGANLIDPRAGTFWAVSIDPFDTDVPHADPITLDDETRELALDFLRILEGKGA